MSVNVKSENLFNFPPRGCYDSDVAEYIAQTKVGECFKEVLSLFVSIFLMNTAKMHFQLDFFVLMITNCTSGGQVLMIIMRS